MCGKPSGGARALDIWARIRSSGKPQPARLMARSGEVWVELIDGEEGVAPGQACVFYESGAPQARILGGGWIAATEAERRTGGDGVISEKVAPRENQGPDVLAPASGR